MKALRSLLCLLIVSFLTFGFAGQIMAANDVETTVSEDGRVQIKLEFDDIKEAEWAAGYITKMQSKNVFQGFSDGTFRPNQPVTRVQAIVTAVRLMGLEDEAKGKSPDSNLHFKDANILDKKFSWAKGYVVVALEHGLFDTNEDQIQPEKPASRVWVSSLLVKSLGLQAEALRQMTKTPDFIDADSIRAGAVGYVNVAVEKGIISGYPDGTFKPDKNVTRAEMAALLDRTNDGLLENAGATTVSGIVKDIHFTPSVTDGVYNSNSVTNSVYHPVNGQITIETLNKESLSYGISSEFLVEYRNKFIRADLLALNDKVNLVVQDEQVIEAELLEKTSDPSNSILGIIDFEFKVDLTGKEKIILEYKNKKGKTEAKVEKESKKYKDKLKGQEAVEFIEQLFDDVGFTENMSQTEAVNGLLSALDIDKDKLKSLKLKIKFSNGKQLKVENKEDDGDNNDQGDNNDHGDED